MSTQTQKISLQPGSINEVLNAIKTELHEDISDFQIFISDDNMLLLIQQLQKDILCQVKFLTYSYPEMGNYLSFPHACGDSLEDPSRGLQTAVLLTKIAPSEKGRPNN